MSYLRYGEYLSLARAGDGSVLQPVKQKTGFLSGQSWVWKAAATEVELHGLVQVYSDTAGLEQASDPHDPGRIKYGHVVTLRSQTKSKSPDRFLRAERTPVWKGHAQNLEMVHKFKLRYPEPQGGGTYGCDEYGTQNYEEVNHGSKVLLESVAQEGLFVSCPAGGAVVLVKLGADGVVPAECLVEVKQVDVHSLVAGPDLRTTRFPDIVFQNEAFERGQGDWMGRKEGGTNKCLFTESGPGGEGLVEDGGMPDMQGGMGVWTVMPAGGADADGWRYAKNWSVPVAQWGSCNSTSATPCRTRQWRRGADPDARSSVAGGAAFDALDAAGVRGETKSMVDNANFPRGSSFSPGAAAADSSHDTRQSMASFSSFGAGGNMTSWQGMAKICELQQSVALGLPLDCMGKELDITVSHPSTGSSTMSISIDGADTVDIDLADATAVSSRRDANEAGARLRPSLQGWVEITFASRRAVLCISPYEPVTSFIDEDGHAAQGGKRAFCDDDKTPFRSNFDQIRQVTFDCLPEDLARRQFLRDIRRSRAAYAKLSNLSHSKAVESIFSELRSSAEAETANEGEVAALQAQQQSLEQDIGEAVRRMQENPWHAAFEKEAMAWLEQVKTLHQRQKDGAEKGLKLLEDQSHELNELAGSIADLAKKQQKLTLQNGVWIFPDGTKRWRHLMGRKSALFARLEAMGRKQLVNAAGGGMMGNLVANQAGLSASESKGDGDIENQADKADDGRLLPETPPTRPTIFCCRPTRKDEFPEDFENHRLVFKLFTAVCCLNIILMIILAVVPKLS